MRQILGDYLVNCRLSAEQIELNFQKLSLSNRQLAFEGIPDPSSASREAGEKVVEPLTAEKVRRRLERIDKSLAPGPSGVYYRDLYHSRSDDLLSAMFNAVLRIGKMEIVTPRHDLQRQ